MSDASPRPWHVVSDSEQRGHNEIYDVEDNPVLQYYEGEGWLSDADAALIVDAVNERAKFEAARMEFPDFRPVIIAAGQRDAAVAERDELRDLCVLLFDAVKHGNQVTDLPALWNKAEEVLKRTDPEDKP